ncbi:hypothetical protein, partial [Clostridium perfringens]
MAIDARLNGDDLAFGGLGDARHGAAVDRAGGQMEQEIDHTRAIVMIEQAIIGGERTWADAAEARDGGKERVQNRGAHGGRIAA